MNHLLPRNRNRPGDDPIFALNREANERRARGERVINATVGMLLEDDGSLAVLPSVLEALNSVPAARAAAYAPIAGDPAFLSAVVGDLLGGHPLADCAVAVATPGGSGALRHAVTNFLERDQAVLTTAFHWGPYATICDEAERRLHTFAMFDAHGALDLPGLERAIDATIRTQDRLLLVLNDPCHNPTGYSMDAREWSSVLDLVAAAAKRVPVTVLLDVAYLAYAPAPRDLLAHVAPLAEHALLLFAWSGSKAFTQYGLRVGALVACTPDAAEREAVRRALAFASRGTWSTCSAVGQAAIARCITDGALRPRVEHERARLRELLARRVTAFNTAARSTRLRYPRYDGGFFVTVFAPEGPAAAAKLKSDGIFVVPGTGALRVALCSVPESDIPELVTALERATVPA